MAGLIFRAKFVIFLSTLSLRRATSAPAIKSCWSSYFYPRSPCGERPKSANTLPAVTLFLSTLSLRRATYTAICLAPPILFLSTLSLRRATLCSLLFFILKIYFYPRSPCGERHDLQGNRHNTIRISIHALLAESDLGGMSERLMGSIFLSTLSLRRATMTEKPEERVDSISIHALLAESDLMPEARELSSIISIHALLAESDSKSAQNSGALLRI